MSEGLACKKKKKTLKLIHCYLRTWDVGVKMSEMETFNNLIGSNVNRIVIFVILPKVSLERPRSVPQVQQS